MFNAGYRNYIFRLYHQVVDGHSYSSIDIYIAKNAEQALLMKKK